jgi:hypothetical protein
MSNCGRRIVPRWALALGLLLAGLPSSAASTPLWQPPFPISIVWSHDAAGHPVDAAHSRLVNVSVWPSSQASCSTDVAAAGAGGIRIFIAKDNEPTQVYPSAGRLALRVVEGVTFPSDEFDDVPADLADDPTGQYRFTTWAGNVWVHAADPRTLQPNPVVPTSYATVQLGTSSTHESRLSGRTTTKGIRPRSSRQPTSTLRSICLRTRP